MANNKAIALNAQALLCLYSSLTRKECFGDYSKREIVPVILLEYSHSSRLVKILQL